MKISKILPLIALMLLAAALLSCSIRKIGDTTPDTAPEAEGTSAETTDASPESDDTAVGTDDSAGTDDAAGTDHAATDTAAGTETVTGTEPATDAPDTAAPQAAGEYEPVVMMYHLILDEPYSIYENLFVRPSEFESQLEILNSLGYRYAFADEYGVFEYPTAIITLDDGYEDNYTEMFPLLKKAGAKATVFLATGLVGTDGYLTEAQIREMAQSGLVSFQSHTVDHGELTYYDADGIADQITRSSEYIESLTGRAVTAFAYPAGRFNDFVLAETAKHVRFAFTTESPSNRSVMSDLAIPRYRIPRGYPDSAFREIAEAGMK